MHDICVCYTLFAKSIWKRKKRIISFDFGLKIFIDQRLKVHDLKKIIIITKYIEIVDGMMEGHERGRVGLSP